MHITRYKVEITVDASGDGSAVIAHPNGFVWQIRYVPDGSSPYATGADLTVTEDGSDYPILTMTNIGTSAFTRAPRQAISIPDGTEQTIYDYVGVAKDLTITLAQAGNATTGVFWVYIGQSS